VSDITKDIFAVGVWNEITVTPEMLTQLANNFTRLSSVLDVPLKLGHNEEQVLAQADGQPALGWVSKVWVEGEKLFATFTDVPGIVKEAFKKKLYRDVSIEASFEVNHKGVDYGTVLTAVALLGVDMPAVNTLEDLKTYMTANNLAFSSHATFSKKPTINHSGESTMMDAKEQAEFDALKAKVTAQELVIGENATAAAKFTTQAAKDKATIEEMKSSSEATAFAVEKKTIEDDLEALVKEGKATPGQRDQLMKDFTAETKNQVMFSINVLKVGTESKPGTKFSAKDDKDNKDKGDLLASERVDIEVSKLTAANSNLSYGDAINTVFSANPELAREYTDENDGE